ncbi:MAG: hypothetical protein ACRD8W_04190 [Nitrososphaeraceae archaeon]
MDIKSDHFINSLEELIQNLTGAEIKFNKAERRKIRTRFNKLQKFRKEWYQQNLSSLQSGNKRELYLNYINDLTRVALNVSDSTSPALDLASYYVSSILAFEERYKFVKETNYLKYKSALDNLIEVIDNKQKYEKVKEFSRTLPVKDLFSTSQFAFELSSVPDLLEHKFGTTNSPTIMGYIDIYRKLGTFMEKAIRILIAVEMIIGGMTVAYPDIKRFNIGNYVAHLNSKGIFRPLVSSFNITVYNATKHPVGGVRVQPSSKSVDFMDNQNTVSWKYETLVRQTRDLYALVYLLSHFEDFLNCHKIKRLLAGSR